jgi:polygalacturonase
MKKIVLSCLALIFAAGASAQDPQRAWSREYRRIERSIREPKFKNRDYPVTDFGAVPNDEHTLNHAAINRAIEACSAAGGGRVVVPAGTWHTGPITLLSDVNLHLEAGAVLLFTDDRSQYPFVLTRWEGLDCYNFQPMIYAYDQQNIALTGQGIVDGGATMENWWPMCGAAHYGWREGMISQRTGRPKLLRWAEDKVPIARRRLTPQDGMRPQLVNFYKCENVLIEDVTCLRSPFWVLHPLMCTNLTVRGVRIQNDGPNGDGCDPESCRNVLIENCLFDTGDDCIAIKSGRNNDGRFWNIPSENIIVRGCEMLDGHGGVVIGSEISGGYRNLFVHDCVMDSPNLDRVIRIKTSTCRGGVIENVYVRDVTVGQCREAVLRINLKYEENELCDRSFPPIVRNVNLDRITCRNSRYGVVIFGLDEGTNVYDVTVSNSTFDGVTDPAINNITGRFAAVTFDKLRINGRLVDSPLF